jgi:alanyl-tRNA synthetase
LDLTQDALREKGREADVDGFNKAMDAQKAKARAAWSGTGEAADSAIWFDIVDAYGATDFLGYDTETAEGQVATLVQDGKQSDIAKAGEEVQIILNQTPFYAESGGQVGDQGVIKTETGIAKVTDTKKSQGIFIHIATVQEGEISKGSAAVLNVDHTRRTSIRANHSATHLLHEALREALGDHVAQRGSLNAQDRLRFDFSHSNALSLEEIARVEKDVNTYIRQNAPVETRIMTPDDARALGAQALFGEKYGDEVRVVSMGTQAGSGKGAQGDTYSLELCGGTHVRQTGDIGAFVLLGDSASSAGVRRIEALTGQPALDYLRAQDMRLAEIAIDLKAPAADAPARVKALLEERKALSNEVAQLRRELAMSGGSGQGGAEAETVNDMSFIAQVLTGVSGKDLPALIDEHKARIGSGAVLLIADAGGKAAVAAGVTDDCKDKFSAVDLVKAAVVELGGKGGGGRPDMAQGGGKDVSNADAAIAAAKKVLEG